MQSIRSVAGRRSSADRLRLALLTSIAAAVQGHQWGGESGRGPGALTAHQLLLAEEVLNMGPRTKVPDLSGYAACLGGIRCMPRGWTEIRSLARPLLEFTRQSSVLLELRQGGPQGFLDLCHGAVG
jgi:hypothetical protein